MEVTKNTNSQKNEQLKNLVIKGALLLRKELPEDVLLDLIKNKVYNTKSAKLILKKAKELANNRTFDSPEMTEEKRPDFPKILEKWKEGCRPLSKCIMASSVDDSFLIEQEEIKKGYREQQTKYEEKLLELGLPLEIVLKKNPENLIDAAELSLAEKLGIKQVARTAFIGLMEGKSKEELAVRLSYVLDLNLDAVYRLVLYIALHARPELRQFKKPRNNSNVVMKLALVLPVTIALVAKELAKASKVLVLGFAAFGVMIAFPLFRRYLGERAIKHRRKNTPDALITLAHDDRAPILYLRSHVVDGSGQDPNSYHSHFTNYTKMMTIEEKLSQVFSAVGPMVALEGPSEGLPNLGATRVRIKDVEKLKWQELILGLIVRSSLVVVRFRPTEGTRWEVEQLLHLCPPHQLIFILTTPKDSAKEYATSWSELRLILQRHVVGDLPKNLREHNYCLGFNTEFQPKIFGKKSTLFGKTSAFLDAVIGASAFGNPLFDEYGASIEALNSL